MSEANTLPKASMSEDFAARLKKEREQLGLNQSELAEMAQIPASSISHFEAGTREPAIGTLVRLANALKVTTDKLLGRDAWGNDIESRLSLLENEVDRLKRRYFEPFRNLVIDEAKP